MHATNPQKLVVTRRVRKLDQASNVRVIQKTITLTPKMGGVVSNVSTVIRECNHL